MHDPLTDLPNRELFRDRLNGALQSMLDAVVGPGRAVVTTAAELDFEQVELVK